MKRFMAFFFLLLSILLTAHTSSIDTYSPGYYYAIESVVDIYPIFTFQFSDSSILYITEADSTLLDQTVYMSAPMASIPVTACSHIQTYDLEFKRGIVYAWYIHDLNTDAYSRVRYFSIGSYRAMGDMLLSELLNMFFRDSPEYQMIIQSGYVPTGNIMINSKIADINMVRYYLKEADPEKITVKLRHNE